MVVFFAAIGLLVVVGWLLSYWNSLDDTPRFRDGSRMNAAQAKDYERVKAVRKVEELEEELSRLKRERTEKV
jgi:hypothetical protein